MLIWHFSSDDDLFDILIALYLKKGGDIATALLVGAAIVHRAFYSGSSLSPLSKETAVSLQLMVCYAELLLCTA